MALGSARAQLAWLFSLSLSLTSAVAACTLDRTGGAGGSANSGGQGGTGTACSSVAQCPETTECIGYECSAGRCTPTVVPKGTPVVAGQTETDCKVVACDGAGSVVVLNDDSDPPLDPNPCTTDTCSEGSPVHDPVPDGTACGQSLRCEAGVCSGCTQDAQCPAGDDCRTAICETSTGNCGFTIEIGKVIPPDDPTDCVQEQCNDQGNVETVGDATEVPPDVDPCLIEGCSSGGQVTNTPATDGTGCPGANYCYGGACVECGVVAECGAPPTCKQYQCNANSCALVDAPAGPLPDLTPGDCSWEACDGMGNAVDIGDTDLPTDPDPDDCILPLCSGGVPSTTTLPDGTPCPSGVSICCGGSGSCCPGANVACIVGVCCPPARTCDGGATCCSGMDMECCADGVTCGTTGC